MTLLFSLDLNTPLAKILAKKLSADLGIVDFKRFPDGETYLRVKSDVTGKKVVILASLDRPDDKLLPLIFLSETLKALDAKQIGLICPYLAYMRQDRSFHEGEGITSRYFSKLISNSFDWLITVDPHLHRYHSLSEIYSIPNRVVHSASLISKWIQDQIKNPLLIGPDSESGQWVQDVAARAQAPHIILQKIRHGDREVEVLTPNIEKWKNYTPVLVDDIISTGNTMIETIIHLKKAGMQPPVCIGIHGVFAEDAYEKLLKAGASTIVTSNTIFHESNKIDVSELIAEDVEFFGHC